MKRIIFLLSVFLVCSCIHQDPHTYQASYVVNALNIGEDKSLVVSANPSFSDFHPIISQTGLKQKVIDLGNQVDVEPYAWNSLTGLFHKNRFPKNLDGLFVVENLSSNPQKCFIYLEGAYPSKRLKSSRFISNSGIRIDSLKSKVDSLLKIKDYKSLNSYWEEIHKINQEIALEVPPKQKILLPWR